MPDFDPENFKSGALIDDRPQSAKDKDYFIQEAVATAAPVVWKEKKEDEWRKYPDQDQDGSGSCVAQTLKKNAGVLLHQKEGRYLEFSATPPYQNRSNRPSPGMIGVEAYDWWLNHGMTLEALVPSMRMSDAEMDAYKVEEYEKELGRVFRIGGHIGIPNGDFDMLASTLQVTGKSAMIYIYATVAEWNKFIPDLMVPNLPLDHTTPVRHSIAAIEPFKYKGMEVIRIEDSAHFGGRTQRLITREFFKRRNYFIRYPMNFRFQDPNAPVPVPPATFTRPVEFIPLDENQQISNPELNEAQMEEVVKVQDFLKAKGFFPLNTNSTGYYGAITAKGVRNWQVFNWKRFNALDPQWTEQTLHDLEGKNWGPLSIKIANEG